MSHENKDPTRVAAGLKATLNNPRVSDEAKDSAADRLDRLQGGELNKEEKNSVVEPQNISDNQLRGYKATISNPRNSAAAKQHAREILDAAGIQEDDDEYDETDLTTATRGHKGVGTGHGESHNTRVIGGYKAALRNPNISTEAKEHAREYLAYHGESVD